MIARQHCNGCIEDYLNDRDGCGYRQRAALVVRVKVSTKSGGTVATPREVPDCKTVTGYSFVLPVKEAS